MNRLLSLTVAAVMVAMLCSCGGKPEVYTADINPLAWEQGDRVSVSFPNEDTLSRRSISVVLRYVKEAGPAEIRFVVSTVTPGGLVWSDTVAMHRDAGTQVSTDIWENEMQYRAGVLFGEKGLYKFHFKPVDETMGVYAVGVHLIK